MNITLILSASTFLVVPLVTVGSVYYFREDILKVYDKYCTNFPVDLRIGNGSESRVLPENRIEIKEIKEIELTEINKYVIVKNPDNNISIGKEIKID
jgi:hypothetical protein